MIFINVRTKASLTPAKGHLLYHQKLRDWTSTVDAQN